jgi:hypothetical protein
MTTTNDLKTAMDAVNILGKQVTLASTPPIQFSFDSGQQLQQGNWSYHDGGTFGIGGVATRTHTTSQQKDGSQLFSITGPYRATGLWYLAVSTVGWKSGQHTLSCDYMNVSGPDGMHELDGRLQDANGFGENCSTAWVKHYPDVAPDDAVVVSDPKGAWADTKVRLANAFPVGSWVHRATVMNIDFEKELFGIVSVQIGSNVYPVNQNFKAIPSNWTRNEMLIQVQPYCAADTGNGPPLSVAVNNLGLV